MPKARAISRPVASGFAVIHSRSSDNEGSCFTITRPLLPRARGRGAAPAGGGRGGRSGQQGACFMRCALACCARRVTPIAVTPIDQAPYPDARSPLPCSLVLWLQIQAPRRTPARAVARQALPGEYPRARAIPSTTAHIRACPIPLPLCSRSTHTRPILAVSPAIRIRAQPTGVPSRRANRCNAPSSIPSTSNASSTFCSSMNTTPPQRVASRQIVGQTYGQHPPK